jgi:hypothetical protein
MGASATLLLALLVSHLFVLSYSDTQWNFAAYSEFGFFNDSSNWSAEVEIYLNRNKL